MISMLYVYKGREGGASFIWSFFLFVCLFVYIDSSIYLSIHLTLVIYTHLQS